MLAYDFSQLWPHVKDMVIAYLLAFPIGWEREFADRSAGLRTFPLVAVAACGFILATEQSVGDNAEARASIVEGIISGMGFIGGGAILKQDNSVRGTATAASLWTTGAIGVASAMERYEIALLLSLVCFITLKLLAPVKKEQKEPPLQ